jgi:hypothetical protein
MSAFGRPLVTHVSTPRRLNRPNVSRVEPIPPPRALRASIDVALRATISRGRNEFSKSLGLPMHNAHPRAAAPADRFMRVAHQVVGLLAPALLALLESAYGVWHRSRSICRFLGRRQAQALTMADLDSVLFVEYGYSNKLPLALVEVAQDIGQEKPTRVIRELAKMSNLPAFVALYTPARKPSPVSPAWP